MQLLTPAEAYAVASQWGSFLSAGDPGAVFYTFPGDDARPQTGAHRGECLAYVATLLAEQEEVVLETTSTAAFEEAYADYEELRALRGFFAVASLRGAH